MPIINIDHKKGYEELNKIFLLNQGFENYYLGEVYEIIKLKIDERGAEI